MSKTLWITKTNVEEIIIKILERQGPWTDETLARAITDALDQAGYLITKIGKSSK
jgi:hypothetical protein